MRRQPLRGQGASPSVRRRKPNGPLLLRVEYFHLLRQNPCRRARKCRFFPGHGVPRGRGEGLTISPSWGQGPGKVGEGRGTNLRRIGPSFGEGSDSTPGPPPLCLSEAPGLPLRGRLRGGRSREREPFSAGVEKGAILRGRGEEPPGFELDVGRAPLTGALARAVPARDSSTGAARRDGGARGRD
jgi:hypothetical protein